MSSPRLLDSGDPQYSELPDHVELLSRVRELERRLEMLESRLDLVKRDAVVILLNLLVKSMKQIASGEFDIDDLSSASETQSSKWDAIKKKLPPRHAEAIDILMLQGSMRRKQLAAALKMDYSNCSSNLIGPLLRQGWFVDNGGSLSLKDL
jgi:hypothetical protein